VPLLSVGGALFAVAAGIVEFVRASVEGFAPDGPVEHLSIDPPQESDDGPDPAFRSYYAGPVLLDYQQILARAFRQTWAGIVAGSRDHYDIAARRSLVHRVWSWPGEFDNGYVLIVVTLSALAAVIGLVVGTLGAFGLMAVASVIFGMMLAAIVL